MEQRGISIDRQVLARLSGEFAKESERLEGEIQKIAGEPINPGSPKQLGDVLFGTLGLPGGTKTKTGAWSTSASILEDLAEQGHELPQKILDWRQVSKLRSTYTDALPNYVHPKTQRVHTSYALAATTDRTALVVRAEPAEHPDPQRAGPQNPPRLHRRPRATSSSPPTIRRSNCGCSRKSPTCRRCGRRSRTAPTFTP